MTKPTDTIRKKNLVFFIFQIIKSLENATTSQLDNSCSKRQIITKNHEQNFNQCYHNNISFILYYLAIRSNHDYPKLIILTRILK